MSEWGTELLEATFVLVGLVLATTGVRSFLDTTNPKRLTTAAFWILLGAMFALGNVLPFWVLGLMVIGIGVVTLAKGVATGTLDEGTSAERAAGASRLGNWLFLGPLSLAAIAVAISTWAPFGEESGTLSIAVASVASLLLVWVLTRAPARVVVSQSDRLLQQVGPVGMLPQFLAMLGVIFTASGVGEVVANAIAGIVPEGNRLAGVIAYCLGMALFTAIVGNAFAAFTVITAGIGVPFVFALGGDPVIAGALAMTAGFCGTLITPMAANFNALPVALLQMKDGNGVIKAQAPLALVLFGAHILLMYYLVF
ncbi:MAG TPA: DUF979 domain-containing protein [Propionibacteriaceae bacterium]|jgi:uncharacterized membrane protein|nr:DUF979 domain-containing protein [Propionibacteriaceae bacterium]